MDMVGINTEMRKLHNYHMISTKAKGYRVQTSITMKPMPTPTFERNIISRIDLNTSLERIDGLRSLPTTKNQVEGLH